LDERRLRQWAAEACELNWGGVPLISRDGIVSINAGIRELNQPTDQRSLESARVRCPVGGRKRLVEADANQFAAMEALIVP